MGNELGIDISTRIAIDKEIDEFIRKNEPRTDSEREQRDKEANDDEDFFFEQYRSNQKLGSDYEEEGDPWDLDENDRQEIVEEIFTSWDHFDPYFDGSDDVAVMKSAALASDRRPVMVGVAPAAAPAALLALLDPKFQIVRAGIEAARDFLASDAGRQAKKDVKGKLKLLRKVYEGAKELKEAHEHYKDLTEESDADKIINEVKKVIQQLEQTEETIKQGFKELIAHDDFVMYRREVEGPVQKLFDMYTRCNTVISEITTDEFIEDCKKDSMKPTHLMSTVYTYLDEKSNIIMTHLKNDKYDYKTYKQWYESVVNTTDRLILLDTFYYGLVFANDKSAKAKSFQEGEMKFNMEMLERTKRRLREIELERLKHFHETGRAKEVLLETFNKVKLELKGKITIDFLSQNIKLLANQWYSINGEQHFYLAASRGNTQDCCAEFAQFHVGDNSKVTVVPDAAFVSEESNLYLKFRDGICLTLIQPITPEMADYHNSTLTKERNKKMLEIVDKFGGKKYDEVTLPSIKDDILKLTDKPPLYIFFQRSYYTPSGKQKAELIEHCSSVFDVAVLGSKPYWPKKYSKMMHTGSLGWRKNYRGIPYRVYLQIIF